MSGKNEHPQQLLPRVAPPADLAERIMTAIALEPAPPWENAVHQPASKDKTALLGICLGAGALLTCVALMVLVPGLASWAIASMAAALAKTKALVDDLLWLTRLGCKLMVQTAMLLSPLFSVVGNLATAGATVGRAFSTGKLVGWLAICTASVVAGQILLWRLLSATGRPLQLKRR